MERRLQSYSMLCIVLAMILMMGAMPVDVGAMASTDKHEETEDVESEIEEFYCKQGDFFNPVQDDLYRFSLFGESIIQLREQKSILALVWNVKYQLEQKHYAIRRFCVSPNSAVILNLISSVTSEYEVGQPKFMVSFHLKKNFANYSFDDFSDVPPRFQRVDAGQALEKIIEGYSKSDVVMSILDNKTTWGLRNLFYVLAVNNQGEMAAFGNNNAIYYLDLDQKTSRKIKELEVTLNGTTWPRLFQGLSFNEIGTKLKIFYSSLAQKEYSLPASEIVEL